ncbi:hypothetical protein J6590_046430 [Homalodisca vitripennis]|nr:hypothetical protein J6590_046430 [Homalodisca vitripennis]
MEWKRNKEDNWHMARSKSTRGDHVQEKKKYNKDGDNYFESKSTRGDYVQEKKKYNKDGNNYFESKSTRGDYVQEKKKYNKDGDNYFEGTGVQKNKKTRRPRQAEATPPSMAQGLSVPSGSSGPPPVNAWSQKKGSALFSKAPEVDDEDEMLKLVLQESLKTAEEDKKRQRERFRMMNMEVPKNSGKEECSENENALQEEKSISRSAQFDVHRPSNDLHFIETDSDENPVQNQRRKSVPSRIRKSSDAQDKIAAPPIVKKNSSGRHETLYSDFPSVQDGTNSNLEPSGPCEMPHPYSVETANTSSRPYIKKTLNHDSNKDIPENDYQAHSSTNDLSTSFKLGLTFGDTKDLLDPEQSNDIFKSSAITENHKFETSSHIHNKNTFPANSISPYPDCTETDIMLHNFIRHDPPSSAISNPTERTDLSTDVFTNQQRNVLEQGLNGTSTGIILSNTNGQDSSSSMSNSPLQNVTPYGSLDNMSQHMKMGTFQVPPQNTMFPFQIPIGPQGNQEAANLQALQLAASRNLACSAGVSPGYAPVNPAMRSLVPGLAQYHQPPSNIPMPPSQYHPTSPNIAIPPPAGTDLSHGHWYQTHYQQMAINAIQHQQAQSVHEPINVASNIGHPQVIQQQTQPATVTHNQHIMMPLPVNPNLIQSQAKLNVPATQETSVHHLQHQISYQNAGEQALINKVKSQELYQQIIQCRQQLHQLQQEFVVSQAQPSMQIQQTPQPVAYPVHPLALSANHVYPVMPGLVQNQQLPNNEKISPTTQQGYPNMDEIFNTVTSVPESSASQVLSGVGRGRGRLP